MIKSYAEHQEVNRMLENLKHQSDFPIFDKNKNVWKSLKGSGISVYILTDNGIKIPLAWAFKKLNPGVRTRNKKRIYTYQMITYFKRKGFTIRNTKNPLKIWKPSLEKTKLNLRQLLIKFNCLPHSKKEKLRMIKAMLKNDTITTTTAMKYIKSLFLPNVSQFRPRTKGHTIIISGHKYPRERGKIYTSSKKQSLENAISIHLSTFKS